MNNKLSISFFFITLISLFVSVISVVDSRFLGAIGFFGFPVSILWIGINKVFQGKKEGNSKWVPIGLVIIIVGLITLSIVIGLTLVALSWSDN